MIIEQIVNKALSDKDRYLVRYNEPGVGLDEQGNMVVVNREITITIQGAIDISRNTIKHLHDRLKDSLKKKDAFKNQTEEQLLTNFIVTHWAIIIENPD